MNSKANASALALAVIVTTMASSDVLASHFRGAALTPSVSADGILTIDSTSFWRQSALASTCNFPHGCTGSSVTVSNGAGLGLNSPSIASQTQDLTDTRRTETTERYSFDISSGGAGLYDISWSGSSWTSGIPNAGFPTASRDYGTTSRIYWDGKTASTPIQFNLNNIQQEVGRNAPYSANLGAVSASGVSLSYAETLSRGISSQPAGYSISSSGNLEITDAGTSAITDNTSNTGADVAFSGEIEGSDGSSIEFAWVFDAVDEVNVPEVENQVINALVGDGISTTVVASDPDDEMLTFDLVNFLGPAAGTGDVSFDPMTQLFQWDSTGFVESQYVASVRATNASGFSDTGTITINLSDDERPVGVPAPGTLLLLATGLLAVCGTSRSREAVKRPRA